MPSQKNSDPLTYGLCPCCGQRIRLDISNIIQTAQLTTHQGVALKALAAKGDWITSYELASKIWANDIDGGPTAVESAVSQLVSRARLRVRRANIDWLRIDTGRNGYRLLIVQPKRKTGIALQ